MTSLRVRKNIVSSSCILIALTVIITLSFPATHYISKWDYFEILLHGSDSSRDVSLGNLVEKLLESKQEMDMENKYWALDLLVRITDLIIPSFYKNSDPSPPPSIQVFDPRLTLGVYLYNMKFNKKLPFHWYDWVDLSVLNQHILSPEAKKPTCDVFDTAVAKISDTSMFCTTAATSTIPTGIGFEIFNAPTFQLSEEKSIQVAKGYLYTRAPTPRRVLFNSKSGELRGFETSGKERLITSELVENYLMEYPSARIDVVDQFQDVINNNSRTIYPIKELEYERIIPESQFVFDFNSSIASLKAKESKLKDNERAYLQSLVHSDFLVSKTAVPKYFHEPKILASTHGSHYDWRFFNGVILGSEEQELVLHRLVRSWLLFTRNADINTWIAHGSLLSWHWNGMNFPWDNDVDVQMPIMDLHKLALHYNQSVIVEDIEEGFGRYFLDVGSLITLRENDNGLNNIDARFIDVDTGIYIDITGLAPTNSLPSKSYIDELPLDFFNGEHETSPKDINIKLGLYSCRNGHVSRYKDLLPLKKTVIAGEIGYIPNSHIDTLKAEYNKGVHASTFDGYIFQPQLRLWVKERDVRNYMMDPSIWINYHQNINYADTLSSLETETLLKIRLIEMKTPYHLSQGDIIRAESLSNEQLVEFLTKDELLIQYLITKEITEFHQLELKGMLSGISTVSLVKGLQPFQPSNHDLFTYKLHLNYYQYEIATEKLLDLVAKTG